MKRIEIRGQIGDQIIAEDIRKEIMDAAGEDILIDMNSPGGVVTDGMVIFNALAQHEGKVTVHIDSMCASIATIVSCAADHVIMNDTANFMIHRVWTVAVGNASDFRKTAEIMEMMDAELAEVYAEKTGSEAGRILDLMEAETWMTAQEALNAGFIDEINVVKGSPKAEAGMSDDMRKQFVASLAKVRAFGLRKQV